MQTGINGKILCIDLETNQTDVMELTKTDARRYLGGGALGAALLLKLTSPQTDPLSPENPLIFTPGVTTGVALAGFSRHAATSFSPLTGVAASSEAGGYWGVTLKRAGYDGLIITGAANTLTYIHITPTGVQFHDANHLSGQSPLECNKDIQTRHGNDARTLAIGIAGENKVRFACIAADGRYMHGRSGLGAVMGSKNVKAIAVTGTDPISVADKDFIANTAARFKRDGMSNATIDLLTKMGSAAFTIYQNEDGQLPSYNFRTGIIDGAKNIDGSVITKEAGAGSQGCYACPVRCKHNVSISTDDISVDPDYGSPEYETAATLGSYLGITDTAVLCKANELCAQYGLDTISAGGTIAFVMECAELGLLPSECSDVSIKFGDGRAVLELITKIANRQGSGDLLAEGSYRAAQSWGSTAASFAMCVRGQELPAHDPRAKPVLALGYALSPTGAEHVISEHDPTVDASAPPEVQEMLSELGILQTLDPFELSPEKVRFFAYTQMLYSVFDSLCVCAWCMGPNQFYSLSDLADITKAVTGWPITTWELLKAGERRINLLRTLAIRQGSDITDDELPERMFEPIASGPRAGQKIDKQQFIRARNCYYGIMNWDGRGAPTAGKLHELDLSWVADLV